MTHFRKFFATFLLTLLISGSAFAAKADTRLSIKKQIANRMMHPGDGLEGVVYAHFTVDQLGEIEILSIDSSDERLETFVKNKLEELIMKKDITDPGDDHHMHFFFKSDEQ